MHFFFLFFFFFTILQFFTGLQFPYSVYVSNYIYKLLNCHLYFILNNRNICKSLFSFNYQKKTNFIHFDYSFHTAFFKCNIPKFASFFFLLRKKEIYKYKKYRIS